MSPFPWEQPWLHLGVLVAAVAWDRWLGEPPVAAHPVVWMGWWIRWARIRAPKGDVGALFWGLLMATLLPVGAALFGMVVMLPWVGPLLAVWLLTSSFAVRSLVEAGLRVADDLDAGQVDAARDHLSWLCSRDPTHLDPVQLAASAAESVAENSSDSVVAPVFFFLLGGIPGALAYRCLNTMDAMVGYRGPLEWLGKAAARFDDLANLVPARLTALLLLLVAPTLPETSPRRGLRVLREDRYRTASPNAGWPMAALAGVLGVRLDKPGHYILGADLRDCTAGDLRRACVLGGRAMSLALGGAGLVLVALGLAT
ncbi:adenosylcobinamide-phosphate synthase CbiB [Myxococcota bacterium]|nr:adenosylcobinamide-phosphate synthase CbiB [Myxococcota bacterium]